MAFGATVLVPCAFALIACAYALSTLKDNPRYTYPIASTKRMAVVHFFAAEILSGIQSQAPGTKFGT